jgi:hypothetical protein
MSREKDAAPAVGWGRVKASAVDVDVHRSSGSQSFVRRQPAVDIGVPVSKKRYQ